MGRMSLIVKMGQQAIEVVELRTIIMLLIGNLRGRPRKGRTSPVTRKSLKTSNKRITRRKETL